VQHEPGAVAGREGVVDQQRDVARGSREFGDVDLTQGRVRGGLDEYEAGVRAQGRGELVRRGPGDLGAEQARREDVVRAAVDRADGDDVPFALRDRGEQAGRHRGHAGGERDGVVEALEFGQRLLEPLDGRVAETAVDRHPGHRAGGGELVDAGGLVDDVPGRVGRGQVERGGVDAEFREIVTAGVDGSGAQACGHTCDGEVSSGSGAISSDIIRRCRILSN
jgi:hypothetical protein